MSETMSQEDLFAQMLADRQADLHPDLKPYIEDSKSWGQMLRHPLVYQVPLLSNGDANRVYDQKRAALEEAEAEQEWSTCVWLHERAYRTDALLDYVLGRDDEGQACSLAGQDQEIIDLAADVWVDCENIGQHLDDWAAMFTHARFVGSAKEKAEFDALPETLTVYRGECDDGGWSWTLDPEVAKRFANRFTDDAPNGISQGTVAKADCFGYLTRRGESEVLIRLGCVKP